MPTSTSLSPDHTDLRCPIRDVMNCFGDKWSLLVLFALGGTNAPQRFGALSRSIPDCSQKMLTSTLRKLEQLGLVARTVHAEVPPRVEYALTVDGLSLLPALDGVLDWARNFLTRHNATA
jgi:transcriptional regulator, MarR family